MSSAVRTRSPLLLCSPGKGAAPGAVVADGDYVSLLSSSDGAA